MAKVEFKYEPRPQFEDFHRREQRWSSMVCHRRAGKTVACVGDLLIRATYTKKDNPRFAYIAPFYRQAKDVAWQYLKDMGEGLIVKIRESELRVELFNGAWISLYGADNPDALRGLYLDGVILDEYGDCRPSLWATVVLPTLADRKGWAVFIGTPKGKNHFYEMVERARAEPNWFYKHLPAGTSGILDQDELDEMRAQMSDYAYRQELECDFSAPVIGTYYAQIIADMEHSHRIALNEPVYDPALPVFVAMDLGRSDNTAMWFWQTPPGKDIHVIDYYQSTDEHLDHYLHHLDDKVYEYDTIYLPHDARAKTLQTRRSTVEQFVDHYRDWPDTHIEIVPRLAVQHGIDAVRMILPRSRINQDTCAEGIEALRAYRRTYDEVNKCFSEKPKHDWACLVEGTPVDTPSGPKKIEEFIVGDMTTMGRVKRAGFVRMSATVNLHFTNGREVECSPEHKFFTRSGLIMAKDLSCDHEFIEEVTWSAKRDGIREAFTANIAAQNIGGGQSGHSTAPRLVADSGSFIECFGRTVSDLSRRVLQWCQKVSGRISARRTGNVARGRRMGESSPLSTPHEYSTDVSITATRERGTTITPKMLAESVYSTEMFMNAMSGESPMDGTSTTKITTGRITTAATSWPSILASTVSTTLKAMRGLGRKRTKLKLLRPVEHTGRVRPVYDVEVEHNHCYKLSAGMLCSNSDGSDAFRYLALAVQPKPIVIESATQPKNYSLEATPLKLQELFDDREHAQAHNRYAKLRM